MFKVEMEPVWPAWRVEPLVVWISGILIAGDLEETLEKS